LYKHVGDKVEQGEKLFTIYAENSQKMKYAKEVFELYDGFVVS
ncbi:hypothetical protein JXC34_02430, partial [Candidatus Woesearchaeota archaeon]|nr:hypothetical protein [Candidatus Woesearchaeota archaeon]